MEYKGKLEDNTGNNFEIEHNHDEFLKVIDGQIDDDLIIGRNHSYKLEVKGKTSAIDSSPTKLASIESFGSGNAVVVFGEKRFSKAIRVANNDHVYVLQGDEDVSLVGTNYAKKLAFMDEVVLSDEITNMKKLTQSQYDSLLSKDSNTLYLILG